MNVPSPYTGGESYIFVSYAHKDAAAVWEIIEKMQASGFRLWFDQGIEGGEKWPDVIARQLENCGYFIAFVSANYLASENCMDELEFVRELGPDRLLVYLEDVDLPGGVRLRHGRLPAIRVNDFPEKTAFYEALFAASGIGRHRASASYGPEPRPGMPAEEALAEGRKREAAGDFAAAAAYYRAAAEQGNAEAQFRLGCCYFFGKGVVQDFEAARGYLQGPADLGSADAQNLLGLCYAMDFSEQAERKAEAYFRLAAAQGHEEARENLAFCQANRRGRETSIDDVIGGRFCGYGSRYKNWTAKILKYLADGGNAFAQYQAGRNYEEGGLFERNYDLAVKYYRLAAAQGEEGAKAALRRLGYKA